MDGMTLHDLDLLKRLNESKASVARRLTFDEVKAQMLFESVRLELDRCTSIWYTRIHKASESGDATDACSDAQVVPTMKDTTIEQESEDEDNSSDKEGNKCAAAAELDEDIVD